METNRKYRVSCSGSGWSVYTLSGEKVVQASSRIDALEKWYELEGWHKPSKWY